METVHLLRTTLEHLYTTQWSFLSVGDGLTTKRQFPGKILTHIKCPLINLSNTRHPKNVRGCCRTHILASYLVRREQMQGKKLFLDKEVTRFRLSERVPPHNLYRRLAELVDWSFLDEQTHAL